VTTLPQAWQAALEHRRKHFDLADPDMCVRLLHGEDRTLRCDRFGTVCWFYQYETEQPPSANQVYESLTAASGAVHWHMHGMHDRGSNPQTGLHAASVGAPDTWNTVENGLTMELRAGSGQSPGLFLDQRSNRAWVREHANGARILNLFAYTGAFGIAALAGGAAEVVQVDTSRSYLDWARANAILNGFTEDRVEYSAVDARLLVDGCRKRGRRFDGIICDPPSFGRGRDRNTRLFRIEHDLGDLVLSCRELVEPGGWILVSSNYEGWTQARFENVVGVGVVSKVDSIEAAPGAGDDFRSTDSAPLLKSCILRLS